MSAPLVALVALLAATLTADAIYVDELAGTLSAKMESPGLQEYFTENLIEVSSWNVRYIPTRTICNFLEKTKPTIFGLQDIKRERIDEIAGKNAIQECDAIKHRYEVFPGSPNTNRAARGRYNPIFYKKDRRLKLARGSQITSANGGTFWLSDKPEYRGSNLNDDGSGYQKATTPRTCTWLKFRFAEQKKISYLQARPFRAKIMQILRNSIRTRGGDRDRVTRAVRRRRVYYKWSYFYVANTRLENRQSAVTRSQMRILNDYFKNIVLDRRRYPVVFMGDFGTTKQSATYADIREQGWIDDTEEPRNALEKKQTSNYIVRTSQMKGVFADSLFEGDWPYTIARPVYAAFLTNNSPKREKESNE